MCTPGEVDTLCAWPRCAFSADVDSDSRGSEDSHFDAGRKAYAHVGWHTASAVGG